MTSEVSCKFRFYVLGLKDGFRGYKLVEDLKRLNFEVEIVWGIDGRTSEIFVSDLDAHVSIFFSNRILTNAERATTLGHWKMFENALRGDEDFSVFLEDDAKLCDFNLLDQSLTEIADSNRKGKANHLWLLIKRDFNEARVWRQRKDSKFFSNTLTIPTLSSAYVINRRGLIALSKALGSRETTGHAPDFPAFYADYLRFKVPAESVFDVTGEESVIGNERWLMARYEKYHSARQIARFTMVSWLVQGRKYSSLKSYLLYFHGRKLSHLKSKLHRDRSGRER